MEVKEMINKIKTTNSLSQLNRNLKGSSSPWKDELVCGCHHMVSERKIKQYLNQYVQLIPGIMQHCH
jgi:hypothetical protein